MKKGSAFLYLAVAAVVAGVVLFAYLTQDQLTPVVVGGPAPEISTFDLEGTPRTLGDYRGQVVLLNIWATWCSPCKEEMPSMQRLFDQVADEDFQVLAVSIDRPPGDHDPTNPVGGKLEAFADSLDLSFTILHDPAAEIRVSYQTAGVPESFLIDRMGVIRERISGPREWDSPANVQRIRELLDEAAG